MNRAKPGFTLVELLVVIAILGVVAGMAVYLISGVQDSSERQAVQAELATIRKACLQYQKDMGEPPRYLAELMQSPSSSDVFGGWWWRSDGTPAERLKSFDPPVGRGWNGPYLRPEIISSESEEAVESRTAASGSVEEIVSNHASGRRLTLLCSEYGRHPQKRDDGKVRSHFQLDFSKADELYVRFVHDPSRPADEGNTVARLGMGIKP